MPRAKRVTKTCVCDGSGAFTNPFDQQFKCNGDVHKKTPKKRKRLA